MSTTMTNWDKAALLEPIERDVRLDFFRGIGLWMIFLDHIPHDVVSWLTLRNYGFSDAAEFFVFISGYLSASSMRRSFAAVCFSQRSSACGSGPASSTSPTSCCF